MMAIGGDDDQIVVAGEVDQSDVGNEIFDLTWIVVVGMRVGFSDNRSLGHGGRANYDMNLLLFLFKKTISNDRD